MSRIKMGAVVFILASALALSCSMRPSQAIAHDGGHGGGGGGHGGGFGGGDHNSFEGDGDGSFGGDHFESHADFHDHPERMSRHFHHGGYFFNNFGNAEDDCYPEWAYDHQKHPFRSDVCAD